MRDLGKKQLTLQLQTPLQAVPPELARYQLELSADGTQLIYRFATEEAQIGIAKLLRRLAEHGIDFKDLQTSQTSLEEIFVSLVGQHR